MVSIKIDYSIHLGLGVIVYRFRSFRFYQVISQTNLLLLGPHCFLVVLCHLEDLVVLLQGFHLDHFSQDHHSAQLIQNYLEDLVHLLFPLVQDHLCYLLSLSLFGLVLLSKIHLKI